MTCDQKSEKKAEKQAKAVQKQENTMILISWTLDIQTDSVKQAKEYWEQMEAKEEREELIWQQ